MSKPKARSEYSYSIEREIRLEWDAINGTYKAIQTVVTDPVILDRIETIIKHARTLGNYETALRRDVAP